jgi:dihydrolipoamide dehydrogenase
MVVGEIVHHSDLLVIGGGPGGYVAALHAAALGLDVTLVEKARLGGVCLQHGCIPSKAWITAAADYHRAQGLSALGLPLAPQEIDIARLKAFTHATVDRLTQGVATLLKGRHVHVVQGTGRLIGPTSAEVEGPDGRQIHHFRHAIIATGSHAAELEVLRPDGSQVVLPRAFFELERLPEHLVIVGAGYIGVELGMAAARLGGHVSMVEALPRALAGVSPWLVEPVLRRMQELGIDLRLERRILAATRAPDGVHLKLSGPQGEEEIQADLALVAVGRRPNVEDIGLEAVGLPATGYLAVDRQMRTAVPTIMAVGDVTGPPLLAHRAEAQGRAAAEVAAGRPAAFEPQAIPAVVYSDPEIAVAGLSYEEAQAQGYDVVRGRFPLRALGRALAGRAGDGFAEVYALRPDGAILGGAVVGEHASDLIGEVVLAIEMGATLEDLAEVIHPHPTFSESWGEAALAGLGLPLHTLRQEGSR